MENDKVGRLLGHSEVPILSCFDVVSEGADWSFKHVLC